MNKKEKEIIAKIRNDFTPILNYFALREKVANSDLRPEQKEDLYTKINNEDQNSQTMVIMETKGNKQGRNISLQISINRKWYSVISGMLSEFDLWIETQIKKTVIDRICSENFLVPDLTLADLTEQEKSI